MLFSNKYFKVFYSPTSAVENSALPEDLPVEKSSVDKLIDYVMESPHNTNPAILRQFIRDLTTEDLNELKGSTFNPKEEGEEPYIIR